MLDKPFRRIAKELKLNKDLARAAKVHDFVTRAISGHATEEMHQHYGTVAANEMREGLAQIVSIAGVRAA